MPTHVLLIYLVKIVEGAADAKTEQPVTVLTVGVLARQDGTGCHVIHHVLKDSMVPRVREHADVGMAAALGLMVHVLARRGGGVSFVRKLAQKVDGVPIVRTHVSVLTQQVAPVSMALVCAQRVGQAVTAHNRVWKVFSDQAAGRYVNAEMGLRVHGFTEIVSAPPVGQAIYATNLAPKGLMEQIVFYSVNA